MLRQCHIAVFTHILCSRVHSHVPSRHVVSAGCQKSNFKGAVCPHVLICGHHSGTASVFVNFPNSHEGFTCVAAISSANDPLDRRTTRLESRIAIKPPSLTGWSKVLVSR